MCGIFGTISNAAIDKLELETLVRYARQRGRDSSGLMYYVHDQYLIKRADYDIFQLLKKVRPYACTLVLGHSRLITNGLADNQPVVRDGICVFHNGIIVNDAEIWKQISPARKLQIDSEVIAAIAEEHLAQGHDLDTLPGKVLSLCKGVVACALVLTRLGKLVLFSNNGSVYAGKNDKGLYFSSEKYPLTQVGCTGIQQLRGDDTLIVDIPASQNEVQVSDDNIRMENLIPELGQTKSEEDLLVHHIPVLKRCTCCILPETMPFISFNDDGVCNYCRNYRPRNRPGPKRNCSSWSSLIAVNWAATASCHSRAGGIAATGCTSSSRNSGFDLSPTPMTGGW